MFGCASIVWVIFTSVLSCRAAPSHQGVATIHEPTTKHEVMTIPLRAGTLDTTSEGCREQTPHLSVEHDSPYLHLTNIKSAELHIPLPSKHFPGIGHLIEKLLGIKPDSLTSETTEEISTPVEQQDQKNEPNENSNFPDSTENSKSSPNSERDSETSTPMVTTQNSDTEVVAGSEEQQSYPAGESSEKEHLEESSGSDKDPNGSEDFPSNWEDSLENEPPKTGESLERDDGSEEINKKEESLESNSSSDEESTESSISSEESIQNSESFEETTESEEDIIEEDKENTEIPSKDVSKETTQIAMSDEVTDSTPLVEATDNAVTGQPESFGSSEESTEQEGSSVSEESSESEESLESEESNETDEWSEQTEASETDVSDTNTTESEVSEQTETLEIDVGNPNSGVSEISEQTEASEVETSNIDSDVNEMSEQTEASEVEVSYTNSGVNEIREQTEATIDVSNPNLGVSEISEQTEATEIYVSSTISYAAMVTKGTSEEATSDPFDDYEIKDYEKKKCDCDGKPENYYDYDFEKVSEPTKVIMPPRCPTRLEQILRGKKDLPVGCPINDVTGSLSSISEHRKENSTKKDGMPEHVIPAFKTSPVVISLIEKLKKLLEEARNELKLVKLGQQSIPSKIINPEKSANTPTDQEDGEGHPSNIFILPKETSAQVVPPLTMTELYDQPITESPEPISDKPQIVPVTMKSIPSLKEISEPILSPPQAEYTTNLPTVTQGISSNEAVSEILESLIIEPQMQETTTSSMAKPEHLAESVTNGFENQWNVPAEEQVLEPLKVKPQDNKEATLQTEAPEKNFMNDQTLNLFTDSETQPPMESLSKPISEGQKTLLNAPTTDSTDDTMNASQTTPNSDSTEPVRELRPGPEKENLAYTNIKTLTASTETDKLGFINIQETGVQEPQTNQVTEEQFNKEIEETYDEGSEKNNYSSDGKDGNQLRRSVSKLEKLSKGLRRASKITPKAAAPPKEPLHIQRSSPEHLLRYHKLAAARLGITPVPLPSPGVKPTPALRYKRQDPPEVFDWHSMDFH